MGWDSAAVVSPLSSRLKHILDECNDIIKGRIRRFIKGGNVPSSHYHHIYLLLTLYSTRLTHSLSHSLTWSSLLSLNMSFPSLTLGAGTHDNHNSMAEQALVRQQQCQKPPPTSTSVAIAGQKRPRGESPSPSPAPPHLVAMSTATTPKPLTSNTLGVKERADLVRKARKLQEVLGVAMQVVDATTALTTPPLTTTSPPATASASSSSNSGGPPQQPRRRVQSLKKRKVEDPKGIVISISTAVHVDTTSASTPASTAANTPIDSEMPAFSPMTPRSPAPFSNSRASIKPPTRPMRTKRSLIAAIAGKSTDSLVQPVVQLAPLTITDSNHNTTRRPSSIASVSTYSSAITSHLPIQFPGVSSDVSNNQRRRFSCPPSPVSSCMDSFPDLSLNSPSGSTSAEALRQRQVNMANKLHRHLGEHIPPELLRNQGAFMCSPSTPNTSPIEPIPLASASTTVSPMKKTHKHSRSIWAGLTNKKSMSRFDDMPLPPLPQTPFAKVAPSRSASASASVTATQSSQPIQPPPPTWTAASERAYQYAAHHQRNASGVSEVYRSTDELLPSQTQTNSQTDWAATLNMLPMPSSTEEQRMRSVREVAEKKDAAILSAKEKSLSVRRAAKMAQKFGEAPPHALFHQITNTTPSATAHRTSPTGVMAPRSPVLHSHPYTYHRHHGRASSLSLSIHSFENDVPGQTAPSMRSRSGSIDGTSIRGSTKSRRSSLNSSVINLNSGERQPRKSARGREPKAATMDVTTSSMKVPVLVRLPASPTASEHSTASISPAKVPTPGSLATLFNSSPPLPSPPPNSPETSNTLATPVSSPSTIKMRRSQSQSFTSRRRQATKLTQFFGVDYPDLYQAMVIDNPTTVLNNQDTPSPSRNRSRSRSRSRPPVTASSSRKNSEEIQRKDATPAILKPSRSKSVARAERIQTASMPTHQPSSRTTFEIVGNESSLPLPPLALVKDIKRRQSVTGTGIVVKSGTWGRPRDPEDVKVVMDKLRELKA
ncbi:hypothetical protein FRB93_003319 [Tulasnella sp. JGI-2019a]|nr:hypothetical protein FRB93_003319 [Tulasnella sp. JGI-2019a]